MDGMKLEVSPVALMVGIHKEDMLDEGMSGKKSTFPAEDLDDEEHSRMEDCRPVRTRGRTFIAFLFP